jgi:hypothetical protein
MIAGQFPTPRTYEDSCLELQNGFLREGDDADTTKGKTRTKRLSPEVSSEKAINFSPTIKQRICFDALVQGE